MPLMRMPMPIHAPAALRTGILHVLHACVSTRRCLSAVPMRLLAWIKKPSPAEDFSLSKKRFWRNDCRKAKLSAVLVRQVAMAPLLDSVLCFTCMNANSENKLQWLLNAESAFITAGFTNWKKASERLSNHETSKCHKEAVLRMITLPTTTQSVDECLSTEHQREKLERRQCLLKFLSNIQFLARQGLPLRGYGSGIHSNFIQLLKL